MVVDIASVPRLHLQSVQSSSCIVLWSQCMYAGLSKENFKNEIKFSLIVWGRGKICVMLGGLHLSLPHTVQSFPACTHIFSNQSAARPTAMRLSLYPTKETGGSRQAGSLDQGLRIFIMVCKTHFNSRHFLNSDLYNDVPRWMLLETFCYGYKQICRAYTYDP